MVSGTEIRSAFDLGAVKRWTEQLHRRERRCSHADFAAAAEYCARTLESAGFERVELLTHRADGMSSAFDCAMPPAWDLRGRSVLRIVGDGTVLADTDVVPFAAAPWSGPTPPGGIVAELTAAVPEEMPDVKGKWVLLTIRDGRNPSGDHLERLRRNGAVGVVATDFLSGGDYPTAVRWFNGTGRFGWYPVAGDERLPLFAVPAECGEMLLRKLAAGKVVLHGEMNTEIHEGVIHTVTAVIPGRSDREFALFSHIYEPFAGDNAIGFGACCGIGQAVRRVCGVPEKTLRVVFSMELYGLAAYLAEPERRERIAGALNMDALNHRRSREFKFVKSPVCAPWFGDWVLPSVLSGAVGGLTEAPGALSDDTFPGDPRCGGIPVNWFVNPSGAAHHCGCADFEPDWERAGREFPELARAVLRMLQFDADRCRTFPALAEDEFREGSRKIAGRDIPRAEKRWLLRALCDYLAGRLGSAERYCRTRLDKSGLVTAYRNAAAAAAGDAEFSETENAAAAVIPVRLKPTPFSMTDIPRDLRRSFRVPRLRYALFDGKRTLLEAIRVADWALGERTGDAGIAEETGRLRHLERHGYVALRSTPAAEV
ncbi:MAG: hypothetical protein MR051_00705 [Lentisphaeria bacterium]|nr:hypothetical protein [Lentisphaeria bacterium]